MIKAVEPRPEPQPIAPGASLEEVAAIAAALELDLARSRAPAGAAEQRPQEQGPWLRAALREGVDRAPRPG